MSDPVDAEQVRAVTRRLAELGIAYAMHEHAPVFTVDEAIREWGAIDAVHCKNLFLRNKKGNRHYLVVAEHDTAIDIARLGELFGGERLSFGSPERLLRCLGLTPGSVSPFGLINDAAHEVVVGVEARLAGVERVGFHPNVNTATVVISGADFARFLAASGNDVRYIDRF